MKEQVHECPEKPDDLIISKSDNESWWNMLWNYEDPYDPCLGSQTIIYCPFCGVKL